MNYSQAKIKVNQALYSYRDSLNGSPPDLKVVSKITNKLIRELRSEGFIIFSDQGTPLDRATFTQQDGQISIVLHAFTEEYTSEDELDDTFD
jgi:hypothetical protein